MTNQIRVLSGAQGIKQAYGLVLSSKKADIICLSQQYEQVLGDFFDREFAPKVYGRVKTREILPDSADNRDYAKNKDAAINQVRFTSMKPTETDVIVTEKAVILISFNPDSAKAVVIEEPELTVFFKEVFEALYFSAK